MVRDYINFTMNTNLEQGFSTASILITLYVIAVTLIYFVFLRPSPRSSVKGKQSEAQLLAEEQCLRENFQNMRAKINKITAPITSSPVSRIDNFPHSDLTGKLKVITNGSRNVKIQPFASFRVSDGVFPIWSKTSSRKSTIFPSLCEKKFSETNITQLP